MRRTVESSATFTALRVCSPMLMPGHFASVAYGGDSFCGPGLHVVRACVGIEIEVVEVVLFCEVYGVFESGCSGVEADAIGY